MMASRKSRDFDSESFHHHYNEENTYRGDDILGEGVFIDWVGLTRAQSRRSSGYDWQSSMATHEVTTRTTLHVGVEGYNPKHPGLYSVTDFDSTGGNL